MFKDDRLTLDGNQLKFSETRLYSSAYLWSCFPLPYAALTLLLLLAPISAFIISSSAKWMDFSIADALGFLYKFPWTSLWRVT